MNRRRTLLFRNGSVHYSNKDAKGSSSKSDSSHIDIEVRSARLNRDSSKTFAEFELLVSLRVRSKLGHAINQWSLFKRYSEISDLNKRIKAQFGWQTEKIVFPPKKMFGSLDPVFLEKRRGELDFYFSQVLSLPDIADFKKHFSSQDLRRFIEYDANEQVKATAEKASAGEEKTGDDGSKSSSGSRRKKKSSSSRKSSNRRSRRRSRAREEGSSSSSSDKKAEAEADASVPALEDATAEAPAAAAGLGPDYAQFQSMQKAGVPEGAIRQKMMSMGVDPDPMFGGGGGGGGGNGGARPPPPRPAVAPRGGRAPPPLPTTARGPPPMPPQKKATAKKKPSGGGGGGGGRGGLLAAIQKGKMLKKTTTKEPKAPGEAAAPSAPANPMMAAILARRKRVE
jgi:hypothetical protein